VIQRTITIPMPTLDYATYDQNRDFFQEKRFKEIICPHLEVKSKLGHREPAPDRRVADVSGAPSRKKSHSEEKWQQKRHYIEH